MNIIKPKVEIWDQESGLEGIYKQIERAGRICYASDPIEGKAKDFVDRMIANNHLAMLEHGTVYLKYPGYSSDSRDDFYTNDKYSKTIYIRGYIYATSNYRVLIENDRLEDLKYLCEPTESHEKRITAHFTTNIGVSREFNRHRVNSIAEQSTRYCNFNKDKFGGVSISLPSWIKKSEVTEEDLEKINELISSGELWSNESHLWDDIEWWVWANMCTTLAYTNLLKLGWAPQQARAVLPLGTNTELIHTAFVSDWDHFFDLRSRGITGKPHPDAKVLADELLDKFIELKLF